MERSVGRNDGTATSEPSLAEAVWAIASQDPKYNENPATSEAMRPFVMALPEVIVDMLGQPVTFEGLIRAKARFLRYAADNGFMRAVYDADPAAFMALPGQNSEIMVDMFGDLMGQLADQFEATAPMVPEMLNRMGITEEQAITDPKIKLSPEAVALYKAGQLTFESLLRLSPMVLLENDEK